MHTDVGWRRMTTGVLVSYPAKFVLKLTLFCKRRPGLDVKLDLARFFRGFTHKKRGSFGCFRSQLIRDDLQGDALGAGFDTLVDEDQEREFIEV
jgi:hypothetical protein